jgi:hypothetical protein
LKLTLYFLIGKEQETDPWASKVSSTAGADYENDNWNTKSRDTPSDCVGNWGSAGRVSSGAEETGDAWGTKGSNDNSKKSAGWGAGSGASWDKPSFSLEVEEPAWSKPRFSDDNNGNSRGGFGRGNRGIGRGHSFGDSRDFDGSRGRGRGRFGRGGRNEGNNFGSGDGGSWGSGRGNSGVLLATQPLLEARILSGKGMMIAGILQGELEEQRNLHGVRQKLLLRKMVSWSKAKGVRAREEAEAAVPGIDLMIHGTTIRVVPLAMADGKLAPEKLSLVDATMYILPV